MPEHVKLTSDQQSTLAVRIANDFEGAKSAHEDRMDRCKRAWRAWRNRPESGDAADADASNYRDPLVQILTFAGWARDVGALLGDDADIEAVPTAPSDQRVVAKISRFMTWMLFSGMQATVELIVFLLYRRLYGRALAYCPWGMDTFDTPEGQKTWWEGPSFLALRPDQIITPAEDARSIQDFSWMIYQERVTPEQLKKGEDDGVYNAVTENWATIQGYSSQAQHRDARAEEIAVEKDESEGVTYFNAHLNSNSLLIHHWYGRWTPHTDPSIPPKTPPIEVVVHYLPGPQKIIGIQRLMDLYPKSRHRRPFVETALVQDGSYWGPGFQEMLEEEAAELSSNHNQFTDAGGFAATPPGFFDPSTGLGDKPIELDAGKLYPVAGGAQGIGWMKPTYEPQFHVLKDQAIRANVERKTGFSDQSMGRSLDRPNAPRTATGQVALLQQGNERLNLDMEVLREDMSKVLRWIWELCCQFAPPELFFRVAEEDADGLFDAEGGFGRMTSEEFGGRYDFRLTFATNVWSREAKKERTLTLYQIDLNNPLIVQNPKALWKMTAKVHAAFGDDNFADLVPEPPDLDSPKNPKEEWTMALEGEEIHVHPADNDDQHLVDHQRRILEQSKLPRPDVAAVNEMGKHIIEHLEQKRAKAAMQTLVDGMAQQAAAALQGGEPPQPGAPMGQPGMPPSAPPFGAPPAGPMMPPGPPMPSSAGNPAANAPMIGALEPGQVPTGRGTL